MRICNLTRKLFHTAAVAALVGATGCSAGQQAARPLKNPIGFQATGENITDLQRVPRGYKFKIDQADSTIDHQLSIIPNPNLNRINVQAHCNAPISTPEVSIVAKDWTESFQMPPVNRVDVNIYDRQNEITGYSHFSTFTYDLYQTFGELTRLEVAIKSFNNNCSIVVTLADRPAKSNQASN